MNIICPPPYTFYGHIRPFYGPQSAFFDKKWSNFQVWLTSGPLKTKKLTLFLIFFCINECTHGINIKEFGVSRILARRCYWKIIDNSSIVEDNRINNFFGTGADVQKWVRFAAYFWIFQLFFKNRRVEPSAIARKVCKV